MARNSKITKKRSDRRPGPAVASGRPRRGRPKICVFCSERATWVDYKDLSTLRRFINDRGRIKARGATGTCAQHQRDVAVAIKTARELALLPYVVRTAATEPRSGRSGDRRNTGTAAAEAARSAAEPDDAAGEASDADEGAAEDPVEPSGSSLDDQA